MADDTSMSLQEQLFGCWCLGATDAVIISEGPLEDTTDTTDQQSTTSNNYNNSTKTTTSSRQSTATARVKSGHEVSVKKAQPEPPSMLQSITTSLENAYLALQVELLHGLNAEPGILEDRVAKRKRENAKRRKEEELYLQKQCEKEEGMNNDNNNDNRNNETAVTTATTTNTVSAVENPGICEVPTMDSAEDEERSS